MFRLFFSLTAVALTATLAVHAEDPRTAQPDPALPKQVQPKAVQPVQPIQPRLPAVTAAKMAQLEEEYETLEANREVKKAYVKAADVAMQISKERYDLLEKAQGASKSELLQVKYDFEMAKAQLEIRSAELKEVEVKIKHAKKRLDDAKAAGVRPGLPIRPVPIDPNATDPLP